MEAAGDYNNDAGAEAVNELLAFDFGRENNILLEKASAAFQSYDCDEAGKILKELRSESANE